MKHRELPDATHIHRLPAVFLRGIAMGAADIVPGVSGGTIAFISGIYLRLLSAIGDILPAFMQLLRQRDLALFWQRIDGTFLVALLGGILTSVVSLARVISYLLESEPVLVWSFFLGLILAAIWHVGREIQHWNVGVVVLLVLGTLLGWGVTQLTPAQLPVTPLTLLGGGALAICAMILPGISGSFILLLLGLYIPVLEAIKHFELGILSIFALGCFLGLISIARLIAWALRRYQDVTLGLLTGFMVGSLNKVWPWKETVAWGEGRNGSPVALVQENLLPFDYAQRTGLPDDVLMAVVAGVAGFMLVMVIEWLGARLGARTPITSS